MNCNGTDLVPVVKEPVVEESVRQEEIAAHDRKVQELAKHKAAEIDVVSLIKRQD